MRDAMGGTVTLVIIVIFIVFALGYMAFNVNYTKAFRMKNKIISTYENYNGDCSSEACKSEIRSYAKTIGYTLGQKMTCGTGNVGVDGLYCYEEFTSGEKDAITGLSSYGVYYRITTKINVEIPVINRILDLRVFYITGDTKTFKIK